MTQLRRIARSISNKNIYVHTQIIYTHIRPSTWKQLNCITWQTHYFIHFVRKRYVTMNADLQVVAWRCGGSCCILHCCRLVVAVTTTTTTIRKGGNYEALQLEGRPTSH